ncbi:MAG: thioredoxin [Gaiellaceae bacterium]
MDVTTDTWADDVIAASGERPVVVDFWAEWCGPCRSLTPVLEAATSERDVRFAKVDVDANPELAEQFGIRGIPAVKAFRNGHVVAEFVGAQSRPAVDAFLDELTKPPVAESVDDPDVEEALGAGDYERAFELLLARIGAEPERRDETRELMVRLFNELGQDHPVTTSYRRRLATALY